MNRCLFSSVRLLWQKRANYFLLLFWIVGFAIGAMCIFFAYDLYAGAIQSVAVMDATVLGLFLLGAIPLMLSYFAIRLSIAPLILIPAFTKAFSFAFCSFGILWTYGSAGWLIRALLLLTDSTWVVILLFFWLRNATGEHETLKRDLLFSVAIGGTVVLIDYLYVVPLLHSVI